MIVDEMHEEHPELLKDQYWDEVVPKDLPYTVASEQYRREEPKGSAEHYKVKDSDALYANVMLGTQIHNHVQHRKAHQDDMYADYVSARYEMNLDLSIFKFTFELPVEPRNQFRADFLPTRLCFHTGNCTFCFTFHRKASTLLWWSEGRTGCSDKSLEWDLCAVLRPLTAAGVLSFRGTAIIVYTVALKQEGYRRRTIPISKCHCMIG